MTEQEQQRAKIQQKAKELGHCVCSKLFPCPCKAFEDKNYCKCSGEVSDMSFAEWLEYNTKKDE